MGFHIVVSTAFPQLNISWAASLISGIQEANFLITGTIIGIKGTKITSIAAPTI